VFAQPALDVVQRVGKMVPQLAAAGQPEPLKTAVSTLRLLCRIFYSLNSPGLTPVRGLRCLVCQGVAALSDEAWLQMLRGAESKAAVLGVL